MNLKRKKKEIPTQNKKPTKNKSQFSVGKLLLGMCPYLDCG